jgi:tripartite-type tricarboxylate transporter receptor subunit TctC
LPISPNSRAVAVAMAVSAALAWHSAARAQQAYPAKPIRLILPFPPGGSTDIVARLIGQKLTESWGQPVLIENRPGAGGNIAAETAARAAPDGYTLFQVNVANAIGATLYPKLSYDLITSFAPVIQLATTPYVLLAHPTVPAKNTTELIALAKARPGQLNYASAGGGSATHLSGELLKSMAGVNIVHVPYKGTGPAVTALMSGEVDLYFATVPAALPLVEAKKLRALGVTSARRSALMRDVPAIAEAGLKGYETSTWHGILAPAGTSPEIVVKLNVEIARILAQSAVKERLVGQGLDPVGGTPEQFGAYLKTEISKWAVVVKASGARAE